MTMRTHTANRRRRDDSGYQLAGTPPFAGLLICLFGTVLAKGFVPEQVAPPGALRGCGVVLACALLISGSATAVRNPRTLFRGESIIMFALVLWLLFDIIQGAYGLTLVGKEDVTRAIWSIGLFAMGVWIALLHKPWNVPRFVLRSSRADFSSRRLFAVATLAFVLGMLKYAIGVKFDVLEMFWWLGRGRWAAPWGRGQLGGWDAFSDHLAYFGYLLPALTVLIARKSGWLAAKTIGAIAMSVVVVMFLADGGGRRIIGVVFAAALVTYVLSARHIRIRQFVVTVSTVGALLWVLGWMLDYRNVGYRVAFSGGGAAAVETTQTGHYHIDDNFQRLTQIVHFIPDYQPYVYLKYVVWVAVRPIPRLFWSGKPIDPGFDLPEMLGMQGVALSSSVVGELYASWGMIAALLGGWFYGRLGGVANQLLRGPPTASSLLIFSMSLLALFAGVRSMLDLVLMSYPILAWVGLVWFYRKFFPHTRRYVSPTNDLPGSPGEYAPRIVPRT